jgi:hypothetical protein
MALYATFEEDGEIVTRLTSYADEASAKLWRPSQPRWQIRARSLAEAERMADDIWNGGTYDTDRRKGQFVRAVIATWPASERVQLLDGPADQCLVPGVAPVPLALRQCEAEAKRRQARRLGHTLPAGGLFDETARAQADLF